MNRILRSQLPPNPRDLAVFDTTTGSSPGRTRWSNSLNRWVGVIAILILSTLGVAAQTTIIDPAGDGGFNNGTTFAANGWTVANSASVNTWVVGTSTTAGMTAPFAGNKAYVSNTTGTNNNYSNTASTKVYFYRDVTLPAGSVYMPLTFTYVSNGEGSWDIMQIFIAPTTVTPVAGTHPGSGTTLIPADLTGATQLGFYQLVSAPTTTTAVIPSSFAGQTVRLIFMWKSDTSGGSSPAASVDNISLTAANAIPTFTASATGGLWSSPATWIGGVVPPIGPVVIPSGSTVIVDQVVSGISSLDISGTLMWNGSANAMTVAGNVTVNAGGSLLPYTSAGTTGVNMNIAGNLENNGYINMAAGATTAGVINFNGSGSTISGTGTFQGDGTNGIIRVLQFANTGSNVISTTQNLVTYDLRLDGGTLNTNGKLTLDNTKLVYNLPFNTGVASIAVTNMGAGYSAQPMIGPTGAARWAASLAVTAGNVRAWGGNLYVVTGAGTTGTTGPSHTSGTATNGGATLLWVGTSGCIGNAFILSPAVGTQYFYGDNLYVCTAGGANSALATAPPTHTSGTVASGTAAFKYVGTVAKASANFDLTTGTVRSISVTQAGSGYFNATAPGLVIVADQGTAPTTAAAATVVVFQSIASPANSVARRSPGTTLTGGLTINSDGSASTTSSNNIQALSGVEAVYIAGNPGVYNNTTAPNIGFSLPNNLNLVTNGGSGCTSPAVTVTGGTLISGTGLTNTAFNLTWANGSVTSVYCGTPGTATYSVPPTIAVTGCTTLPTLAWPLNCLPLATAVLDVNGMIKAINVTNKGYGYNAAPTVGYSTLATGPTATAGAPTARLGLYNYTIAVNAPTTSASSPVTEDAFIPSNRIINALSLGTNAAGLNISGGNLTLIGTTPLSLTATTVGNILDLGGNTLSFPWNQYGGVSGTYNVGGTRAFVRNGSISMHGRGTNTWVYPFAGSGTTSVQVFTGSATPALGTNITTGTVSDLGAPSNTTAGGSGFAMGNRSYRFNSTTLGGGAGVAGSNATIRLPWNDLDGLTTTQNMTFVAEAPASTGAWTVRSNAAGASGALAATGTITTLTSVPGPATLANGNIYAFSTLVPSVTDINVTSLCANSSGFTITGTNFTGVTSVQIGGVNVGSFTVVNATTITGFAGAVATGVVTVTNSAGASASGTQTVTVVASPNAPTVSATAQTVLLGNAANITASGNGGTFNWYTQANGGASVLTGATLNLVPCATTTYYVAEGDGTCEGARTAVTITVSTPTITASTPTFCGTGGTTTLTATNLSSSATTVWSSLTAGATLGTTTTSTADVTVTGTSDFKLTVSVPGCTAFETFYSVGVYPLPTATVSTSASGVCPGTQATINSGLSAGNFSAVCITPRTTLSTPPANAVTLCTGGVATTPLSGGSLDDGYWNNRPIGFNFNWFTSPPTPGQTQVMVGTNGTIIVGGGTSTQYNFTGGFPSLANPANCIAACARDLQLASVGGNFGFGGGTVRTWTEGIAPNRRFVVQYANCATWYSTNANDGKSSVEVVLYETLGNVEIYVIEATNPTATTGSFINDTRNKFIGLQDPTRTIGATAPNCSSPFQANYWNGISNQITSPLAWRFVPPANYLTVWNATPAGGSPVGLTTNVDGSTINTINGFTATVAPTVTTTYSISYTNATTFCSNAANPAQVIMTVLSETAPSGVSATSTISTVCSGANIPLSTDYTGITDGLTYQWQVSTDAGANWNNITGATLATYTATQTVASSYRVGIASCGGTISYSAPVAIAMSSFFDCYCGSTATTTADEEITNVTLGTLNNSSTCTTVAPGPGSVASQYSNYASGVGAPAALSLVQGASVSGSITVGSCGTFNYTSGAAIFIDYNQNGVFTDAGEMVWNNGPTANINCVPASTVPVSFTIPANATPGITRMRVISVESTAGAAITPCLSYGFGETEDYRVQILGPCDPALFTPPLASADEPDATVCGTQTSQLTAFDFNGSANPIYMWYSAAVGGTLLQNSTSNFFNPGPLTATTTWYVATNTGSCITARFPVTLNWIAAPAITASNSNPAFCGTVGSPTNLTATSSNAGYAYTWSASPSVGSGLAAGTTGGTVNAVTPTVNGVYTYTASASDATTGCTATATTTVGFYAPLSGLATVTQPAVCGGTGSVNFAVNGSGTVFTSDFSSSTLPANVTLSGNSAAITGGVLRVNSAAASQNGGILINNTTGLAANDFQIDFDYIATAGSSEAADGFSYSYGADVVGLPTGLGSTVVGATVAPGTTQPENGSGTGLKLSFDAYTNGANTNGVYLMYNTPIWNQTPASSGVIGYVNDVTWRANATTGTTPATGLSTHVTIKISNTGLVQLFLNNNPTPVISGTLPAAYLTADKSTWKHAFSGRTGGLFQGQFVDNLIVQYNNFYEYSVNNGTTWTTTTPVAVSSPAAVQNLARYISVPSCSVDLGSATVAFPVAAPTAVTGGSVCLNGTTLNVSAFGLPNGGQTASYSFGTGLQSGVGTANLGAGIAPSVQGNSITISLPAGAIVTGAQLVLTNVTSSFMGELQVALSGSVTLGTTQVFTNFPASGATGTISLSPSSIVSGGVVNVLLGESYDDAGTDATVADISLVVTYSVPALPSWFNNAVPSSGSFLATASPYNVVGTSVLPSTSTPGTATVYAANVVTNGGSTCYSASVPATLTVGQPLTVSVAPTSTVSQVFTLASGYSVTAGATQTLNGTITLPAGAVVTNTVLQLVGTSSTGGTWGNEVNVSMSGASTVNSQVVANVNGAITNQTYNYTATNIAPPGGDVSVTFVHTYGFGGPLTVGSVNVIVSYTAPVTGNVCPGAPVTLTATTTGGGGSQAYQWNLNGAPISGATASSYTTNPTLATDVYTVTVVDACNPSGVSSTGYSQPFFAVTAGTITGPSAILVNDFTAPIPGAGTWTIAGQTAGSTIQWSAGTVATGPFTGIGGATTSTQTLFATGGAGTVFLTATTTTPNGCSIQANVVTVVLGNAYDTPCTAGPVTVGNQAGVTFSTAASTVDAGEVAPPAGGCNVQNGWCDSNLNGTIWFSFVAPASGHVSIAAPGWDNQLALYSATSCSNYGTFTLINANDDGAGASAILSDVKCLTPGVTYYIQLDGYSAVGVTTLVITDLGNTAPVITGTLPNLTANAGTGICTASASWSIPTASDDQGCVNMTSNFSPGASFPVGVTTVTYTATDAQGLVTTSSFTVTVTDAQLPTITAPSAVTVTAALNTCTATATLGSATTADNCGVASTTNNAPATFPIGTTTVVWTVTDVNGNVATANQVVTVLVNPANLWYVDTDGDGYGVAGASVLACSQPAGYAANTTDCNNNNAAVNPAAIEICGNSIDDNCNGLSEEGCTNPGENPSNATSMSASVWPNCNSVNGTLVNASVSGSAQTVCITGEDKWHQFVATSEGISIQVNTTAIDVVIELQTAAGVLVAQENAVAGLGGEILNHYGLTAGQVYRVGVRNFNSALGTGTYAICARMLKRGGCDYGPGPYSLCQYFKATWAGAAGATYTFTFTGLTGPAAGNVYTRTQNTDICVLSNVLPTLPYGSTYSVLISNTYTINNGAGVPEAISVPALSPCTMNTIAQPVTALRTSDQCAAGPRFRGAVVASLPWVCGTTNWRWEFTELNAQGQPVGLPITVNRGAASNFINLGTVLQLQFGKTYSVRTAPILSYTGTNYQWGAPVCMSIVGSAGMIADGSQANNQTVRVETANEVNMSLYPNPTHGTDVNINLSGVDSENVQIRIVDAMGRQVWNNRYSVSGVLNTNITFERPLANGLYMVEAIFNGEVHTQRLMVQK